MELHQLNCFLEVAKLEHITQAAEQLHITQPALSKVIARLEEDLGVKLFDREGKNIRLNEYGTVVMNYARRVFNSLGDMQAELEEMSAGAAGMLRIGSSFPAGEPNWILECIRTFALWRSVKSNWPCPPLRWRAAALSGGSCLWKKWASFSPYTTLWPPDRNCP